MLSAPIPQNEQERIASLRKMNLLSFPDEEDFNRVTRIAQRMFWVPIALISLTDADRQWYKSCIGMPQRETDRDIAFCSHAIAEDKLFVVEDAMNDPRFADNPMVTGIPRVAFYAGRPLRNPEGHVIGTLCIIDHEPRLFDQEERDSLNDLGHWVEHLLHGRTLSETQQALIAELDDGRRDSLLDPMLNIWHREAAEKMLEKETHRARRHKKPLSVMMVSIRNLAQISASYGQSVSDAALTEFARIAGKHLRPFDTLGRYCDEQLVIILPDADAAYAKKIADGLITDADIPVLVRDELVAIRCVTGITTANFTDDTPAPQELFHRASAALNEKH